MRFARVVLQLYGYVENPTHVNVRPIDEYLRPVGSVRTIPVDQINWEGEGVHAGYLTIPLKAGGMAILLNETPNRINNLPDYSNIEQRLAQEFEKP